MIPFTALVYLLIHMCDRITAIEALFLLDHLQVLEICNCPSLTSISRLPGSLTKFVVDDCRSIIALPVLPPVISRLKLQSTSITACTAAMIQPLIELKSLFLFNNRVMASIDESICQRLTRTAILDLGFCESLPRLPRTISCLVSLINLDLHCCHALTSLPESIGQLAKLDTLNLSCCGMLTSLPESIGQLANLETLDLGYCELLTSLPESIGQLAKLHTLNIESTRITEIPESAGYLSSLQQLDLADSAIHRLPLSFYQLSMYLEIYPSDHRFLFPPFNIMQEGMEAIVPFLLQHHHPLKILFLIMAARRMRRMRLYPTLPSEIWNMILDEFLKYYT